MKWYGVQKGHQPGVYKTWKECEKQVKCFSDGKFKLFKTREEVEEYYLESLRQGEMSNHEVGNNATQIWPTMSNHQIRNNAAHIGSSRVKDFIMVMQFIVIVFMWFFYVR